MTSPGQTRPGAALAFGVGITYAERFAKAENDLLKLRSA